jgi:hypothetical protein
VLSSFDNNHWLNVFGIAIVQNPTISEVGIRRDLSSIPLISKAWKFLYYWRFGFKMGMLFYLVFNISQPAVAQQTPAITDSLAKIDTSKVYRKIETFSKKNRFRRIMYGLLFKPVAPVPPKKRHPKLPQLPYSNFEGKIIRNINIVTCDPYGYSLNDTAVERQNIFLKTANNLHVKTQRFTIKNILLMRENKLFDSLLVKESERLIRSQSFVREALFRAVMADSTTDSVDIDIRELDKWSIIPEGNFSAKQITFGFTENNFIGFGHEFHNEYTRNRINGKQAFTSNYFIPNIRNTYISAVLNYYRDEQENSGKGIAVERPFYSPLARWAAGVHIMQQFQKDTIADTITDYVGQNIKFNTLDYWAGYPKKIIKGNTEDARATNAIIAARYLRIRYHGKPDEMHDSLHRYSDEDFYLAGIGISLRKYYQDHYIFNFGYIEDVPVGRVYGITAGYQVRDAIDRLYLGARVSFGDYTEFGYIGTTIEYGTFVRRSLIEQGVFAAEAHYFSNLIQIGNWRIRQFMKPQITLGINRFSYDSLTINNGNGISGFNSTVRGTNKMVLTFQLQSYAPWNVLGFRFGPFLMCSLGMLSNAISGFKNSRLYSQFGLGALIKNDYLVFNNFQLSISYYPIIPGSGYDKIKLNSFRTTDFGFRDFNFGKPEILAYQ